MLLLKVVQTTEQNKDGTLAKILCCRVDVLHPNIRGQLGTEISGRTQSSRDSDKSDKQRAPNTIPKTQNPREVKESCIPRHNSGNIVPKGTDDPCQKKTYTETCPALSIPRLLRLLPTQLHRED